MQEPKNTVLVGYTDAATKLGIRVATLYSLVSQRRIPHVRLGRRFVRFDLRELDAWVDGRRVGPVVVNATSVAGPYSDL